MKARVSIADAFRAAKLPVPGAPKVNPWLAATTKPCEIDAKHGQAVSVKIKGVGPWRVLCVACSRSECRKVA